MLFWIIALAALVVVLLLARRYDRRHGKTNVDLYANAEFQQDRAAGRIGHASNNIRNPRS